MRSIVVTPKKSPRTSGIGRAGSPATGHPCRKDPFSPGHPGPRGCPAPRRGRRTGGSAGCDGSFTSAESTAVTGLRSDPDVARPVTTAGRPMTGREPGRIAIEKETSRYRTASADGPVHFREGHLSEANYLVASIVEAAFFSSHDGAWRAAR